MYLGEFVQRIVWRFDQIYVIGTNGGECEASEELKMERMMTGTWLMIRNI